MGYQVGSICFKTAEEATNEVMTQVVPTIDKDGVLHHPVFNGKNWVYHEQSVKLSFPECDYGAYREAGREMGTALMAVMAVVLTVVVIVKAVSMIGERDNEE